MYNIELLYYKTEFRGETESYSETFDTDDTTAILHTTQNLDDQPPTSTKQTTGSF